jgi:drug/metabolite transporter (DMT)-like permease
MLSLKNWPYFLGDYIVFTGELIAITTVLCWTISVQFFGAASKMVGAIPVNLIRIGVALLLFSIFLLVRDGSIVPTDFPLHSWLLLGLSGIIGFFIGDIFLFKALVELGPRVAMLIHSLAAPTAAIIGWLFLKEQYAWHQWFGIFVTLTGVSLVILEKKTKTPIARKLSAGRIPRTGVLYGFLGMLGQAIGYILSKAGMPTESGYLDAFAATEIRTIAAFACFILYFAVTGRWQDVLNALKNRRAVAYTAVGSFLGPFIGVSLSLLVLHYLAVGIAATFLSLVPIAIIPFSIFLYKESVSFRSFAGAAIAVFGISMLMA